MSRSAALFLDRDGVINVDHGYVHRKEDFQFIPGVFALCRRAAHLGYRLFVVTNQAGIGRGYFTEKDFHSLSHWMCERLASEGVLVEGVYFCPTHPTAGVGPYRVESSFRKPGPGMILQAAAEHALELSVSVLIGDKPTDVQAGAAAGVALNILIGEGFAADATSDLPSGCLIARSHQEATEMLPSPVGFTG